MSKALRALRRRILTPDPASASPDVLGFHRGSAEARDLLETVGRTFLAGYATAVESASCDEAERHLEAVPTRFRGFAYEGAAMGYAVLDALPFGGGRVRRFLSGRGADHIYMVYVGIGWALARLPRFRWPDLSEYDPLLRWLILDGYGFHQAYFHTDSYVHRHYRSTSLRWEANGHDWYVNCAIDQGIGRALWFVGGADPDVVAGLVERFPTSRRSDLYGGVGLAATYAGGADESALLAIARHAGEHRRQLVQGCVFAATARVRAHLVTPHTRMATSALCGMTPDEAAGVADAARPTGPTSGAEPEYEVWRIRVANQLERREGASA